MSARVVVMKQLNLLALVFLLGFPSFAALAQNVDADSKKRTQQLNDALSSKDKSALNDEVLDAFFGRLHSEKNPARAHTLARAIWQIWARSGSATADALLKQAEKAMRAGQTHTSISILSLLLEQRPQFAEAWNKRATAYFILRDFEKSKEDISEVLKREPRHFGALSGLGMIYRAQGKNKKALGAFRRALSIHPHLKDVKKAIKRISGQIEQDI